MERRKERLTSLVVGKSEGRGFNKEGGTARSVGSNFHFFHLFAPLTVILKKCHGGTSSRLVDFRPVFPFIGPPPLRELILSLVSPFLTPFLRSLLRPSLSKRMVLFTRSSRVLSPFLSLSPLGTDNLPLQQPLRHFWARQESLCNWHNSAIVIGTKRCTVL